ncbi:MAG: MaoC/PaaZ C-terminal domain-containing protein [Pseudohongiellaceae bacterium]
MTIDPNYLLNRQFPKIRQTYTEKDCMLYALGVGMGMNPLDENCLRFVFEEQLKVVPSQAVMMAHPGFWANEEDIGMDWRKLLHVSQEIVFHNTLPTAATVEATTAISEVSDRGEKLGALVTFGRLVRDVETGKELCTITSTILCRGDGGCGGGRKASPKTAVIPKTEPDLVCDLPTYPQQALLYRLSGDFNPLHASPTAAQEVGFKSPILHGLCTMGIATHALLKSCCDYDTSLFNRIRLRFSAPVYPGDTIRTEMWKHGNEVLFRCKSLEQDSIVINNGCLLLN